MNPTNKFISGLIDLLREHRKETGMHIDQINILYVKYREMNHYHAEGSLEEIKLEAS